MSGDDDHRLHSGRYDSGKDRRKKGLSAILKQGLGAAHALGPSTRQYNGGDHQ